jgi:hypothetical protein
MNEMLSQHEVASSGRLHLRRAANVVDGALMCRVGQGS